MPRFTLAESLALIIGAAAVVLGIHLLRRRHRRRRRPDFSLAFTKESSNMADKIIQSINLHTGSRYTVEAKKAEGGGVTGDALGGIVLSASDPLMVEDNDTTDAATTLVTPAEPGGPFRVTATATFGEDSVEAAADVTLDNEKPEDDFMLVFTKVVA